MTGFRFLHAADVHLDSPLRGLAGQQGQAAERIRGATREALVRLVNRATAEEVAFLIIAGDLYDGDWKDYKTGLFFVEQMGRLNEAGIPVFLLYGNHDAESQITRRLGLPGNVRVFGSSRPQTFTLEESGVVLHGQSFRQRDVTDNLARAYPEPVPGAFNIGVLHTGLGGIGGHENYAPCSIEDLINRDYDYWALGHVHQAQVLHERPFVVFPGNLQGRHIRETGAKGASLVTVKEGEVTSVDTEPCDVVRWAVVEVDVEGAASFEETRERIGRTLEDTVAEQAGDHLLACRLRLTGRSPEREALIANAGHLLAEARAIALGLGEEVAWVEKIQVDALPMTGAADEAQREDAIGELQESLAQAHLDEDLRQRLEEDIGLLASRLPPDVRAEIEDGALRAAVEGDWATLIEDVSPYLCARLTDSVE